MNFTRAALMKRSLGGLHERIATENERSGKKLLARFVLGGVLTAASVRVLMPSGLVMPKGSVGESHDKGSEEEY